MKYTNFDTMPLVLNVEDVADTLAIGRNKAYALVNTGAIKALTGGVHRLHQERRTERLSTGLSAVSTVDSPCSIVKTVEKRYGNE